MSELRTEAAAVISGKFELPFYSPQGNEIDLFNAAHQEKLPVMIKGPTGCGKTRFISHMAAQLGLPLYTVACHDDLTASDLVGRYLIEGGETRWLDGPLTRAVRAGGICYLDEVVEARRDTTVVLHPLTDDRRILPIDGTGECLHAPSSFMLVISYNPGYQSLLKGLKPSTRQRFIAMSFDYPAPEKEANIVSQESGVDIDAATRLVTLATSLRALEDTDLEEAASTRLLIYAGQLIRRGVPPLQACTAALVEPLSDDPGTRNALAAVIQATFPPAH